MKNYKVGDTIYIKDTVNNIDEHDPIGTYRGKYTGWFANRTIIDELPVAEPVKPVLPKGVADELETTKKLNVTFDGYIMRVIDNHYLYTNSHTFWMNSDDGVIKILMDAWYNGYTIEPEKKYNVFAPKSWIAGHEVENRVVAFCKKNNGNIGYYQTCKQYLGASKYQFTIEEIKKYDLENFHKELVTDDSEDC